MRHNEMRVGDITYAETEEWVCDFSVTQKSMAGRIVPHKPVSPMPYQRHPKAEVVKKIENRS